MSERATGPDAPQGRGGRGDFQAWNLIENGKEDDCFLIVIAPRGSTDSVSIAIGNGIVRSVRRKIMKLRSVGLLLVFAFAQHLAIASHFAQLRMHVNNFNCGGVCPCK
ncbi:MAG: hypothetical protein LBJ46_04530 [Planctomycetota bacterium]|nr:hypothetical protein [Planctomycetota bacterium]